MTRCRTCHHPLRAAIDQDLLSKKKSLRLLAAKYGLSLAGLVAHRNHHVLRPLVKGYALRYPREVDKLTKMAVQGLEHAIRSADAGVSLRGIKLYLELIGAFPSPEPSGRHFTETSDPFCE